VLVFRRLYDLLQPVVVLVGLPWQRCAIVRFSLSTPE
jgi:hypothetical protein